MATGFQKSTTKTKRAATAITQQSNQTMEHHIWCIHTEDDITQNEITVYFSNKGESGFSKTRIFYNCKELHVFMVSFAFVMHLNKNEAQRPYKFTAYHKESKGRPWALWKGGEKTVPKQLRKVTHLIFGKGSPLKTKNG
ncbi:MAG: hypothetical protein WC444_02265 [Candidatus Paceibacterota bacterium]